MYRASSLFPPRRLGVTPLVSSLLRADEATPKETEMLGRLPTRTYPASRVELPLDVSYQRFTQAFEGLLGRTDVAVFTALPAMSANEARERLATGVGPLDFTLFQKLDHGAIVTALTSRRLRATTYVFGNALIAVRMTQHDPRAGLYVPLRLLVTEPSEGRVLVTYDLPSALMAQLDSEAIAAVARELDAKVERLLEETERVARNEKATAENCEHVS